MVRYLDMRKTSEITMMEMQVHVFLALCVCKIFIIYLFLCRISRTYQCYGSNILCLVFQKTIAAHFATIHDSLPSV